MSEGRITDTASSPEVDKAREEGSKAFKKEKKCFPWFWVAIVPSIILGSIVLWQNRAIIKTIPFPPAKEASSLGGKEPVEKKQEPVVPSVPDRIKYFPKTPERLTKRQLISRLTDSRIISSFD